MKVAHKTVNEVASVVTRWHYVKWQMKIWLLGVLQWHVIKIFYVCVRMQSMLNLYHMQIGDLNSITGAACRILTSGSNGLPVCFCNRHSQLDCA